MISGKQGGIGASAHARAATDRRVALPARVRIRLLILHNLACCQTMTALRRLADRATKAGPPKPRAGTREMPRKRGVALGRRRPREPVGGPPSRSTKARRCGRALEATELGKRKH